MYQVYSIRERQKGAKLVCKGEMGTAVVISSLPKFTHFLVNTRGPENRGPRGPENRPT